MTIYFLNNVFVLNFKIGYKRLQPWYYYWYKTAAKKKKQLMILHKRHELQNAYFDIISFVKSGLCGEVASNETRGPFPNGVSSGTSGFSSSQHVHSHAYLKR